MKIVRPGDSKKAEGAKKNHWWVGASYQCGTCDCVIKLQVEDVAKMQICSINDVGGIDKYSIPCPTCFSAIELSSSNQVELSNCADCGKEFDKLAVSCRHCRNEVYLAIKGGYEVLSEPSKQSLCSNCFEKLFPKGCFRVVRCHARHEGYETKDEIHTCGKNECFACKDERKRDQRRQSASKA